MYTQAAVMPRLQLRTQDATLAKAMSFGLLWLIAASLSSPMMANAATINDECAMPTETTALADPDGFKEECDTTCNEYFSTALGQEEKARYCRAACSLYVHTVSHDFCSCNCYTSVGLVNAEYIKACLTGCGLADEISGQAQAVEPTPTADPNPSTTNSGIDIQPATINSDYQRDCRDADAETLHMYFPSETATLRCGALIQAETCQRDVVRKLCAASCAACLTTPAPTTPASTTPETESGLDTAHASWSDVRLALEMICLALLCISLIVIVVLYRRLRSERRQLVALPAEKEPSAKKSMEMGFVSRTLNEADLDAAGDYVFDAHYSLSEALHRLEPVQNPHYAPPSSHAMRASQSEDYWMIQGGSLYQAPTAESESMV
ncbi:uncharacterized protein MONBRDRAFT_36235 [Monosiga brevicollis MX1]|uniref:Uncharacterized protein n=1 Tax=Monosiga brevicollis TaxID=81824 RepID=A9UTX9_MONBE|nr:uncharacterized protein MONBRDRAFT_36235 [Monosiga brevicollis MX1]EDQ91571.1 predicted protein [Monosiga brevicollis MX1]|eukprot:XP_001743993.1 hypothetical protein [Monosiga brevicollis MX1]